MKNIVVLFHVPPFSESEISLHQCDFRNDVVDVVEVVEVVAVVEVVEVSEVVEVVEVVKVV